MNNLRAVYDMLKQLSFVLTDKQKKSSIGVFFCMLLGSALELLGISVIYPLLQIMMDESVMRSKWYVQWIYKINPDISSGKVMVGICTIIIFVYLLKNLVSLLCVYVQNKFAAGFQRELSTTILNSIMKRPYEYFVNTNSAVLLRHIHGDTNATYNLLLNIFTFASNTLTTILVGCYLLYTNWKVAIVALLLSFGCFWLTVLTFRKRMKQAGKEMMSAAAEQTKCSYQAVVGIKAVSVMDRRDCFLKKYDMTSRKVEKINVLYSFLTACPDRIIEGICVSGFIGITILQIIIGEDPADFIPVLGTFVIGAFRILPSISQMSSSINGMVYNRPRLAECYDCIKEARRLETEEEERVLKADLEARGGGDVTFRNKVCIKDIDWKYQNASEYVLKDLNLQIKKGEAIALIGASGAGKTTLGDIILGLLRPQKGLIYMDDIDISTIPHKWCKMVGYVPQDVFLLDDSIRSNVAFGLMEDDIDEKRVWEALERAQLSEFVRSLPDGLDTVVGERGVKFSGGQRQRVAIARALYDNPMILVLDEATSALDNETEVAVMEAIDALKRDKTMIIIAHRLSTIRNCDKVYEIKDGIAIEREKKSLFA